MFSKIRSAINYPFLLAPDWFHNLIGHYGYCLCFTTFIDENGKHHNSDYIWRTNKDWQQRFKAEININTKFFDAVLERMKMDKERWGVHESHCCVLHGCKYSDDDCPVKTRQTKQDSICESCEIDGIETIPDPTDPDYDVLEMHEYELRQEVIKLRKRLRAIKERVWQAE